MTIYEPALSVSPSSVSQGTSHQESIDELRASTSVMEAEGQGSGLPVHISHLKPLAPVRPSPEGATSTGLLLCLPGYKTQWVSQNSACDTHLQSHRRLMSLG